MTLLAAQARSGRDRLALSLQCFSVPAVLQHLTFSVWQLSKHMASNLSCWQDCLNSARAHALSPLHLVTPSSRADCTSQAHFASRLTFASLLSQHTGRHGVSRSLMMWPAQSGLVTFKECAGMSGPMGVVGISVEGYRHVTMSLVVHQTCGMSRDMVSGE